MLSSVSASTHLDNCTLCPHRCGPARATGSGVCRVGQTSYIASEMLHVGEESILQPAHAIFFSGCTATCSFCTAARFAFRPTYGVVVSPTQLAQRILKRQREGAASVCFIGGDPVPHIPFIVETLTCLGTARTIPSVFNSNLYLTMAALDLLDGVIDIYLPDFKFGPGSGSETCGEKIGGMPDYWAVITSSLERLIGEHKRVVVRHLLMPGHYECCTVPILQWLGGISKIEVSLLDQYIPPAHAKGKLAQNLERSEVKQAFDLSARLNLNLVS